MEIKNAQIKNVSLCIEDHDILTFYITIESASGGCCLGGYALDQWVPNQDHGDKRVSSPAGLDCMRRIMEVVGVDKWEDLKGKYIRYEDNGWGSYITKIGNIIKDEWIDIKEFFINYDYNDFIKTINRIKQER